MIRRVTRKMWKKLVALLVLFATIVGILANWEAAVAGFHKLFG